MRVPWPHSQSTDPDPNRLSMCTLAYVATPGWCSPPTDGSPVRPHSVSQGFDRRIKRLGLPRIRFHNLRHTSAAT